MNQLSGDSSLASEVGNNLKQESYLPVADEVTFPLLLAVSTESSMEIYLLYVM